MAEVGRFFTSTRHVPMTFGTNPATGERLPGGPYTSVQAFGGIGAGLVMWMTNSLWGTGASLVDLVIGLAAVAGVGWLLRYAPDDLTEITTLGIGITKVLDGPRGGRYEGKPWRPRRTPKPPVGFQVPTLAEAEALETATDLQAEIVQRPRRRLGTSSVDRLLAHTTTEETQR